MNEITICSIVPYERHWERSYGHFRIQPGTIQDPTYLVIGDAQDKYWTDLEKGQFIMVPVQARNIVNDFLSDKELDQGFFSIEGDEPTEAEMNTAIARQRAFYVKLVRLGDTAWAQYGKHEHISDAQRRAAHSLGVQKDWNTIAVANIECPSCGEFVPAHVAMCKHCSAIIDREAYSKLEFAGAPPSQAAAPKAYEDLSEGREAAKEAQPELHESHRPTTTEPVTEGKEA